MKQNIENFIKKYFDARQLSRGHEMVKYISFAHDQKTCDAMLAEMQLGQKQATYRLKKCHDLKLATPPIEDMVMIFADFYGFPVAISRVKATEVIEVKDFTEELAKRIGLGSLNYEAWLERCHNTIAQDCAKVEVEFTPQTLVTLVWFELLFPTRNS